MKLFPILFFLVSLTSVLAADPAKASPGNQDRRVQDEEKWRANFEMFVAYLRDTDTGFPQQQHQGNHGDRNKRGSPKRRKGHGKLERETAREIFSRFPKAGFRKLRRMYLRRREKMVMKEEKGNAKRRTRLWCRGGIGYHMEVTGGGQVVARHRPTDEGSLLCSFICNFEINSFNKF